MTRSMTGFATKLITLHGDNDNRANLAISLKSLNSRFFELTCRLPYQLTNLETELSKIIKKIMCRGHLYLTVHIDNKNLCKGSIKPALSIVKGYQQALQEIQKSCNIQGSLTLEHILQLPDIFTLYDEGLDTESQETILRAITDLAHEVVLEEEKEGTLLQRDILDRIAIMQEEIEKIYQASTLLMDKQKEKIALVLQEFDDEESGENNNKKIELQKQAAYTLLDKMDIHEEIVRFKSHLGSLYAQLHSQEVEKGKRLDFTLQELAREVNTIAAKCSDATIGSMAINIKVELEKSREQSQNIV